MSKTKIILLFSLLLYFVVFNILRNNYLYTTILDDAYIFFRYAENIVNGYGFVWNIGEHPLEGYTSFLYLFILTIIKFLSLDLEIFVIILGTLTTSLTLYFTYILYEHLYADRINNKLSIKVTVILLAVSPAYPYWSAAGMETSFYSMFVVLTVYLFLKLPEKTSYNLIKGILFGLLCVIRFEAVLFFLAALYYLTKEDGSFFKIKVKENALLFTTGFTIIFGTYFIWRWSYFGFFFPNTFYAKTGGGIQQIAGGFLYLFKAMRLFYGYGWIPFILLLFFFRKSMLTEKALYLFSIGLISLITTIIIGGDHFHLGRFVLPVLPLLFVFFPMIIDRMFSTQISSLKISQGFKAIVFVIIVSAFLITKPVYKNAINGFHNFLESRKEILEVYDESSETFIIDWQHGFIIMGETLKNIADSDDYIAVVPVGAIGYFSKKNVIDMVGIVDPVIAHETIPEKHLEKWTSGHTKGDGKYILARKPEFIQLTDYLTKQPLEKPHRRSMQFKSVKEIWQSEEFHQKYEFYPIEVLDGWYYNLFKRKTAGLKE